MLSRKGGVGNFEELETNRKTERDRSAGIGVNNSLDKASEHGHDSQLRDSCSG